MRKKSGGRQAGTPNKATAEIRAVAQQYSHQAVETLALIMANSACDRARIAAAKEILDRAHGKPAQAVEVSNELEPKVTIDSVFTLPEYEAVLRQVLSEC